MPFYPQAQVAFFLTLIAILIVFSYRFKEYDLNRKTRTLIFCYCVTLTTKIIDIVYIYRVDFFGAGAFNIYYTLPLFSCDITLVAAMFMTYFNHKNNGVSNKFYEVINKLITYLLFTNGALIPLLLVSFETGDRYLEMFNYNSTSIYIINNNIVHYTYALLAYLYGSTFNVYKKTYKGFWKILVGNAVLTLAVHIINLFFRAAGHPVSYMYTISYPFDQIQGLVEDFGGGLSGIIMKLIRLPLLENYFGSVIIVSLQLLVIYLVHMIYYKVIRKEGLDNLFYLKLINPTTSITL